MYQRGNALRRRGELPEAIEAYDALTVRFGDSSDADTRRRVAEGLFNKAFVLEQLDRGDASLATYDAVVARYGSAHEPDLQLQAAMALYNKAYVTWKQRGQAEAALRTFAEVVTRFKDSPEPALRDQVAKAMLSQADIRLELGRPDDASAQAGP